MSKVGIYSAFRNPNKSSNLYRDGEFFMLRYGAKMLLKNFWIGIYTFGISHYIY